MSWWHACAGRGFDGKQAANLISSLFLAVWFVGALPMLFAQTVDALPKPLQQDYQKMQQRFQDIEAKLGKVEKKLLEQSLRELRQWIKEFSIEAELFDDDPVMVELNKKLDAAAIKVRDAADPVKPEAIMANKANEGEMMMDGMMMSSKPRPAERIKIAVNMDNISFKRDVAPIIAGACMGCHNANRQAGEFNAASYASFMEHITPNNPDDSHILNLVTGKAEPRMPRGNMRTFSKEWIDVWTAWIKQGAKFDGPSKDAPITQYMISFDQQRREALAKMSTPDLQAMHKAEADRQIAVVKAASPINQFESKNLLVYTTLSATDAEYLSVLAEAVLEDLQNQFGMDTSKPVWRGKLGVNVFTDRVDYVSFAREIDQYAPDDNEFGHCRSRLEHEYLAMTTAVPGTSLDFLLTQKITEAFLQQQVDGLPAWMAYGFARRLAAQWGKKDQNYNAELQEAGRLASLGRNLTNLFNENVPWIEQAPLATSYFAFLHDAGKKADVLYLQAFANTKNWGNAVKSLQTTPEQLNAGWLNWLAKNLRK